MQHTICNMQKQTPTKWGRLTADLKTREQVAYEALRQAVIAGRWKPGESLVISRIALDMGISRIPVTNAVKRLASEGFLRVRPHQEAVVAPLIPAEIREIYLMRANLESLAVAEAARNITPDDLVDIRRLNEEIRTVSAAEDSTIEQIRTADKAFHARIREVANMPHLSQTLQNYADQCEYYRACLLDQHHFASPTPEGHEPLINALESRDIDQLQVLMKDHVLLGMHLILNALEKS